ncbi:hypothetical protein J6500_07210 [Bradyrhizobium sp. WSM 1704]|uniref:hypothetical protein n=1 Tax=Bradyrhizobium semiaridum TaxID=2821404 RepID=UPI001CE35E68|nr:hypothetical protein [Bradyrhizobium semiaridum]MCA6121689.1 hypothetical protein [Bradyrhizobium semiaridum]
MKTPISVRDLESIALREIRCFPGGEYVCYLEVDLLDADWRLRATVRDGADLDRIQYAVRVTTSKLKHRYQLRTDW